jgi:hypothetical protein
MADEPDLFLDMPPPESQRITEIHVWIAKYHNGSQGIVSADLPMPNGLGMRHMPLMSSKRHAAEALEPMAHRARRLAMHQADRIVRVRLVTFRAVPDA